MKNKNKKVFCGTNILVKFTEDFSRNFVIFSLAFSMLALSFLMYIPKEVSSPSGEEGYEVINQEETPFYLKLFKSAFAIYEGKQSEDITPSVPYSKVVYSEIENAQQFESLSGITMSDQQIEVLEQYGFFLTENNIISDQSSFASRDDFVDTYKEFGGGNIYSRNQSNAIFISTDTALHLYHILIDRSFQSIEQDNFQPMLREMTRVLFEDSVKKYNNSEDEKMKESYKILSAYYLVPLVILDSGSNSANIDISPEDYDTFASYIDAVDEAQIANSEGDLYFSLDSKIYDGIELSDDIYELAKSELDLIYKAEGVYKSPIFTPYRMEFLNDYSQFKPRSHYTKNDVLKSYFIAMMWYGRMGFTLNSTELTRDALIITSQINSLKVGDENISDLWANMMDVIEFFVGEVDDLTAYEYTETISKVYGSEGFTDEIFYNDELLQEFVNLAKTELPNPKIVSEALDLYDNSGYRDELLASTKQFRFMGQRFTIDAYIINNLTQGIGTSDPETGQWLPSVPTALMTMKVMSPENETVQEYLDQWIMDPDRIEQQSKIATRESDKIIPKVVSELTDELASYDEEVWSSNIYWSWLDIFRTLLGDYGEGYPYFMQTENWQKKNLGTVLGSYTELKHDTLLYAKQSYAEMGGGGDDEEIPPVVKGYVEPDLTFWNQIIELAYKTKTGLEQRNVFPDDFKFKYQNFIETAEFFRDISEKELQNEVISDDDFEKLRTISNTLRSVVDPVGGQELTQKEKRAGIVADIHTDISGVAIDNSILYEATGKPYIIYVAVKDANGTRLTRGVVYNHYEFTENPDERLSDEDWQAIIYEGAGVAPEQDSWSLELLK